jgi:uncharacterized protein YbcI
VPTPQEEPRPEVGGQLGLAISNAVVRLVAEYTGRGPTKARTVIADNLILVLLQDTLTKGERALVRKGRAEQVTALRSEFQAAMHEDLVAAVEGLTGRKVAAFMSTNHIDPDLGVEIFVLEDGMRFDPTRLTDAARPG